MIERIPIFLTRKSVFEMKVGGSDRLEIWFDRPIRRLRTEDLLFDMEPYTVIDCPTHNPLSGKAFRKMDRRAVGSLSATIWDVMCRTAFPGIEYPDWDGGDLMGEHPDAVPEDEWIGEAFLDMASEPFEGAVEVQIVVTGPFPSWTMWEGDLEAPVGEAMVWFAAPVLAELEGWDFDDAERRAGRRPRRHWAARGFGRGSDPVQPIAVLEQLGLQMLANRAKQAIAVEFGSSGNAIVGRSWSTSFRIWVAVGLPEAEVAA